MMHNNQDYPSFNPAIPPKMQVFLAFSVSLAIAVLYMLKHVAPLDPGLDSSWAYGLNYTFQHDLVLGKDIYFTFGPLGFLEHTRTLSLNMVNASTVFWFACSVAMNLVVLLLSLRTATSNWHAIANLCLALLLIYYANTYMQRLLILVYAGVLYHWYTRHAGMVLLLSLSCVLSLLIKFSHGAITLALFFPYLLAASLRDGRWSVLLIGCASLPAFYLGIWYGIYGGLTGAMNYLYGGLEFSRGSTSASALNPANNWLGIAGFYAAFLTTLLLLERVEAPGSSVQEQLAIKERFSNLLFRFVLPLCFFGPLFIWSKYAFGREDGPHLAAIMTYTFYVGVLWAIIARTIPDKLTCLLVIAVCHFCWMLMQTPETGKAELLEGRDTYSGAAFSDRWKTSELVTTMNNANIDKLAPLRLSPALRDTIGNATVDFYPWETLIAAANNLNWTPRPVYQNYISYTPFLDGLNQQFYNSEKAPDFIVWHYHSFADIDTRYPLSSDPLTLQAILQNYKKLSCDGKFCLWQRVGTKQASVSTTDKPGQATWDEWIPVPPSPADAIRMHVDVRRTMAGKLNLALWKEGGIEIDYRMADSSIRTHGVVIDNAPSGLWVAPYVDMNSPANKPPIAVGQNLLQQWLQAGPAKGYIEKAIQTPAGLHVVGWGILPFKPSSTQRLTLVFYNEKNVYKYTVQNKHRPDITANFNMTGIVDLDTCGFDEVIHVSNMAAGDYQLQFIVKNEGETVISSEPPTRVSISHETRHNVEAVRLRTIRPWAFEKTFALRWSTLTFAGDKPW